MKQLIQDRLKKTDKLRGITNEGDAVPRITNETVAQHREEVLKGARKFIYPLQHSKHKVVLWSGLIALVAAISFFGYCFLSLYRYKSSSTFIYRVTQFLPFPVARVGGKFVPYEDYLFELRQYEHYFVNIEHVDFNNPQSRPQLEAQRKSTLQDTINRAYIRQIAHDKHLVVTDADIDKEIATLRSLNRLGSNDGALEDVIKSYYDWTLSDFRRSISDKLLAMKVLDSLDTTTKARANQAYQELVSGKSFEDVAKTYSDDTATKDKGGELPVLVEQQDRNLPSQLTETLYGMAVGNYSKPFSVGYGLEIVKKLEVKDGKVRGAHILFYYQNINVFLNTAKDKHPARVYLHL